MIRPRYIIKTKKFLNNLAEYQKSGLVYYPIKCNNSRAVLSLISSNNGCFEVETYEHLKQLIRLRIDPNRILFFSPFSQIKDLAKAVEYGVSSFVVGNKSAADFLDSTGIKYKYFVRLREKLVSESCKMLGSSPEELVSIYNSNSNGIFLGISFYLNSEINDSFRRNQMIMHSVNILKEIDDKHAATIDIGGGVSAEECKEAYEYLKSCSDYNLIVEPGRGLMSSCIDMIATVIGLDECNSVAFLNVGIYSGLIDAKIKNRQFEIVPIKVCENAMRKYFLSGPTADIVDVIGEFNLPELHVGDKLIIKNCGAYTDVLSTRFYGYSQKFDYKCI